jgi:hypothetical protein
MPEIGGIHITTILQFVLLVGIVPLQFWLTQSSTEGYRQYQMTQCVCIATFHLVMFVCRMVSSLSSLRENYLNASYWRTICKDMFMWWEKRGAAATSNDDTVPTTVSKRDEYFAGTYITLIAQLYNLNRFTNSSKSTLTASRIPCWSTNSA